jgi:hypothetical protein
MSTPTRIVLRRVLPRVVLNAGIPLVLYLVLQPAIGDVAALAVGAVVPAVAIAVELVLRRRLDPIGVFALLAVAVALVVFLLSGENPLALKLHDVLLTGPLGVVMLVSAAIGRPLLLVVGRALGRRRPDGRTAVPVRSRLLTVGTVLAGAFLTMHAAVILVLALTLPTAVFLAVGRPVGWAVIAVGVLAWWVYRRRLLIGAAQPAPAAVDRVEDLRRPGQDSNLRPRD